MRLLYFTDWLPPEFGAVGQYSLLFARQRAAEGNEVCLVGLAAAGDSETIEKKSCGRLTIRRVRARPYDRTRLARRARWTLRSNLRLLWRARRELMRTDEVLFTGSPPFMVHFLVPLNFLLRRRLTYRITDFHPECLIAELGRAPFLLRLLRALTIRLRRRVDHFEVLGEDQRRRLLDIGIAPERIELKRDPSPVEFSPDTVLAPLPAELADRVVLLYSGNFGVAHDHRTLVDGYRLHHRRDSGRVVLWLNATGAKADTVERELRAEGLPLHRSRPVRLAELPGVLLAPAAHLITLRDEFVGYVLPSKVHACIESGRPVVFIGSDASDVDLLCRSLLPGGRYRRVAMGDAEGFAAALEEIADTANFAQLPQTASPWIGPFAR